MPIFQVSVPDALATAFDVAAAAAGGRSALLRRLMAQACRASDLAGPAPSNDPAPSNGPAVELKVRLASAEAAHVEAQAAALGLRRGTWLRALVRRHALGAPTLPPDQAIAVVEAQRELRRIGVNLNQIARAAHAAALDGRPTGLDPASVDAAAEAVRGELRRLRTALAGQLAYWAVDG